MSNYEAPEYLAPDTYEGKRTVYNAKSDVFSAVELAEIIGEGNTMALFVFYGTNSRGNRIFSRDRFFSTGSELWGYRSDGSKFIGHLPDRRLRIVTQ